MWKERPWINIAGLNSAVYSSRVSVSRCSGKNGGKGVNMVSLVMISYSASPPWLAVLDWNMLWGAGELSWLKWHKCKSLKNIKPSCKIVFEKEGD